MCKKEQRDCLTLGASLFTAGTNLDGGLMELSTDRKHVHKENSARRVETRTGVKSCVKTMPRRKVVDHAER